MLVHWLYSYLPAALIIVWAGPGEHREQYLSEQRQCIVRYMMLHKMSANYVINSYQWTVEQVRAVIERKWRIKISGARLYQLFEQWGLSLQKVSHDCGHAEAQAQAPFYRGLKKRHRSVTMPQWLYWTSLFYRVCPIRIKPELRKIPSPGFLTVDVQSGTETRVLTFNGQSINEQAGHGRRAHCVPVSAKRLQPANFLLDNAKIHGRRMETDVACRNRTVHVVAGAWSWLLAHTSYSPLLNPAE